MRFHGKLTYSDTIAVIEPWLPMATASGSKMADVVENSTALDVDLDQENYFNDSCHIDTPVTGKTVFYGSSKEDVEYAKVFWKSITLQPPMESRLVSGDTRQRLKVASASFQPKNFAHEPVPDSPRLTQFLQEAHRQEHAEETEKRRQLSMKKEQQQLLLLKQREERMQTYQQRRGTRRRPHVRTGEI
ncbi:C11orf88 [Branchiostoma lanceolatum]|uniref:Cilia- and flagella-associated protein HOATZ n=1 Tax=Branchiostoma lanceolatum TaxID=7740 RepID=A0A8J9Z0A6_BRALA|nr:C11orf88 [Branchiostoma lanceolatum]